MATINQKYLTVRNLFNEERTSIERINQNLSSLNARVQQAAIDIETNDLKQINPRQVEEYSNVLKKELAQLTEHRERFNKFHGAVADVLNLSQKAVIDDDCLNNIFLLDADFGRKVSGLFSQAQGFQNELLRKHTHLQKLASQTTHIITDLTNSIKKLNASLKEETSSLTHKVSSIFEGKKDALNIDSFEAPFDATTFMNDFNLPAEEISAPSTNTNEPLKEFSQEDIDAILKEFSSPVLEGQEHKEAPAAPSVYPQEFSQEDIEVAFRNYSPQKLEEKEPKEAPAAPSVNPEEFSAEELDNLLEELSVEPHAQEEIPPMVVQISQEKPIIRKSPRSKPQVANPTPAPILAGRVTRSKTASTTKTNAAPVPEKATPAPLAEKLAPRRSARIAAPAPKKAAATPVKAKIVTTPAAEKPAPRKSARIAAPAPKKAAATPAALDITKADLIQVVKDSAPAATPLRRSARLKK
jgi:hypothetical protein